MTDETKDRPNIVTVDLGGVLHSELLAVCEISGKPKSQLIREALQSFLGACNTNSLLREPSSPEKTKSTSKTKSGSKTKNTDKNRVVRAYNDTFYPGDDNPPKQHWGILSGVINSALKGGRTIDELVELIRVSPNDSFVAGKMRAGEPLPLPSLIKGSMLPNLLNVLNKMQKKEVVMSANDFVEYQHDIVDKHFSDVLPDHSDDFWADVMACESEQEVRKIIKTYKERGYLVNG